MKRNSFTLTELLVVISIMAILMAIISPVLRSSRERAKSILCGSNIKQLTVGLLAYELENTILPYSFYNTSKMAISPPGGYAGDNTFDRMGWWWFNFIKGIYNKSDERNTIVKCPSKWLPNYKLNKDILAGNYGVNLSISKNSNDGKPLNIKDIPKPGETLLIADSGYAMMGWWHATDKTDIVSKTPIENTYVPGLSINKNRELIPGQKQDAINGRHPNKSINVGFADGHISLIKADDLLVEKTDNDYKNKTPLWVPK